MKRVLNISKELRSFLKERDVLEKFRNNTYDPKCFGCGNSKSITISGAFIWDESPEGNDFWYKLHREFNNIKP